MPDITGRIQRLALEHALRQWQGSESAAGADDETPAEEPQGEKKRRGRPKQGEKSSDAKIVAALAHHHQYHPGGSVGDFEPATVDEMAKAAGVSPATVSRFLTREFEDGHKTYEAACRNGRIARRLADWQGEKEETFGDLTDSEYGIDRHENQ